MANLVYVQLVVEKKNKDAFELLVAGEIKPGTCAVDFGKLVPEPSRMEDPYYYGGKMDEWRRANWGGYGAYFAKLVEVDNYFVLDFCCSWHYPYLVVEKFAQKAKVPFAALALEEDHFFWGVDFWDEGELIAENDLESLKHPLNLLIRGSYEEDGEPAERVPTLQEVLDLAWENRNEED